MKEIKEIGEKYLKKDIPEFRAGDTLLVHVKIKEEGKTRVQGFEGIVIKRKGSGVGATFTVRRISYGEGVERTFFLHSPFIHKIEVKKKGAVRRAKLYYLRKRKGKSGKVAEKIEHEKDAAPRAQSPEGRL